MQKTVLLILFLFTGCAISTTQYANRFDTPEATGRSFEGHLGGGLEGGNQLTIVPDVTASPPDTTPSWGRADNIFNLGAGMGILPRLDADLKLAGNSPLLAQLKYQILGDTMLDADEGNLSLAVTAGVASGSNSSTGGSTFGGLTYNYQMSETFYDFAAILGYRFTAAALLYGGPFFTTHSYSVTLTQTQNGTTSIFPISSSFNQRGANLGFRVNASRAYFMLEGAWASATTAASNTSSAFYGGVVGGFRW